MAETLYDCHTRHPGDIIAHRISRMYFDAENALSLFPRPMYYRDRNSAKLDYLESIKQPSFFNKLTGCAGVLYPPGCLHNDVLDKEKCLALAPTNDDIWFWMQAIHNNVKVRVPEKHFAVFKNIPGTEDVGLSIINDLGGEFSRQLRNVIEAYPEINAALRSESAENAKIIDGIIRNDREPLISVICFTRSHGPFIRHCLEGIINQDIKVSTEILIHDAASTDDTPEIIREYEQKYPEKIKVFYHADSREIPLGPALARVEPKGKYTAFFAGDDCWTDPGKLHKQFVFLERHPHFALASTGFDEQQDETSSGKTISCDGAGGFAYNGVEIRAESHYLLSTLLCRKSALKRLAKNYPRFTYWEDIHQAYFLLRAGPGWYFSESCVLHRARTGGVPAHSAEKNKMEKQYRLYRELYRKTGDSEAAALYYRAIEQLLKSRHYRNKTEKARLLIALYAKNRETIAAAARKIIVKIAAKLLGKGAT